MSENKSYTQYLALCFRNGMQYSYNKADYKEAIADRLKEIRLKSKMTQQEFCDKIGINRITYSGYENRRAEPSIYVLVLIADSFGLSLDYVCCRTDNPQGFVSEDESKELAKKVEELTGEVAYLKKLIKELK